MESLIKDISLAPLGHQRIAWAKEYMPLVNELRKKYEAAQPFKGVNMITSIHLEAKTAYFVQTLKACGANVVATGCNPLSTQDEICAALVDSGVTVMATHGCTAEEYDMYLREALKVNPIIFVDDGGDLLGMINAERQDLIPTIIGGSEETTTGIHRLKSLDKAGRLPFPMIDVNDAYMKYLFDNRYGTGQSALDGIIRTTNLALAGRTMVVAGYGWCGKGVAMRAKGMGANVIVTEIDPIKAVEAIFDGFRVMPMVEAAKEGDIFITLTGCKDVITKEAMQNMKNGAVMCNAGHFDCEVNIKDLEKIVRENNILEEVQMEMYDETVAMLAESKEDVEEKSLKGLRFVVTGDLKYWPENTPFPTRKEFKAFIENNEGIILEAEDKSVRCRLTLVEVINHILDKNRSELSDCLFSNVGGNK